MTRTSWRLGAAMMDPGRDFNIYLLVERPDLVPLHIDYRSRASL